MVRCECGEVVPRAQVCQDLAVRNSHECYTRATTQACDRPTLCAVPSCRVAVGEDVSQQGCLSAAHPGVTSAPIPLLCPVLQVADSFVSQREAEEQRRRHDAHEKAAEKAFQLRRAAVAKQEKVGFRQHGHA